MNWETRRKIPRRAEHIKVKGFKPPKKRKIDDSRFIGIATKFLPRGNQ